MRWPKFPESAAASSTATAPPCWRSSALHQFDADAVRGGDIAQQAAADALLQLDREADALLAQFGAEGGQVALVHEAEMVGAPGVMAGEIGVGPDGPGGHRLFTRTAAADQDRHAAHSTKICGAPRAIVSAAIVAPNISTYHSADERGFSLTMWTWSNLNAELLIVSPLTSPPYRVSTDFYGGPGRKDQDLIGYIAECRNASSVSAMPAAAVEAPAVAAPAMEAPA